ncbi:hypothetical protein RUND412_005417 [Rhizina undulata]
MFSQSRLLLLPLTFTLAAADSWGPSWSLGPTNSKIISMKTTVLPGDPPSDPHTLLTIWPGISTTGSGDLIQSTLEQWDDNTWCGATSDQWCIRSGVFNGSGQFDGTASPVSGDQLINIAYVLNDDETAWTQTVTDSATGDVLSSFVSGGGVMKGFGTAAECDDECVGTTSTSYYTNTTIVLAASDPTFSDTASAASGVSVEGFETTDEGKTWTISKITIPAMV